MVYQSTFNVSLDSILQKEKIVYLNFWASWCKSCIQENVLEKMKNYSNKVYFINLCFDDSEDRFNKWKSKFNFGHANILVAKGMNSFFAKKLFLQGLPYNIIIKDSKVASINIPEELMDLYLNKLLELKSK